MKTNMLRHARRAYSNPLASRELNRRNIREWVRAIRVVGDRWVLIDTVRHEA